MCAHQGQTWEYILLKVEQLLNIAQPVKLSLQTVQLKRLSSNISGRSNTTSVRKLPIRPQLKGSVNIIGLGVD